MFILILWTILITTTVAQKVYESTEDIGPEAFLNVTTLYPIPNNKISNNTTNKDTFNKNDNTTSNPKDDNLKNKDVLTRNEKEDLKDEKGKLDATVWKIEAAFAESNLDKHEKENITEVKHTDKKNDTNEFRPSPHLGSFYDEDDIPSVAPTRTSFGSFQPLKKPTSGFVSSINDDHRFNKLPKQILQTHKLYPYKFETPILTRLKDPWKAKGQEDSLESRPTAEIPVKVPAGGLYKYQDPFQEKPVGEDDTFGLEYNDGKENAIKKRVNPWESFMRLVTAFLPVGLIISALTPSIITIENAATPGHTYPSNIYRRSEPETADVPRISERCRRRLLCELHSDNNYKNILSSPHGSKPCHKIHCDDPEALARTLKWLLDHRQYTDRKQ